jgi:hypothetical protein
MVGCPMDKPPRVVADYHQSDLWAYLQTVEARLPNIERLKQVQQNHRGATEMARMDTSLAAVWLLLGAQGAAIDSLLSELVGDEGS